jgi:phage nucleotide-binding protein
MDHLKDVKPAGDKIDRGLSFCIYSNPGVGKTTMATTLPPEETLIINAEAGIGPLLGKGHHVFNVLNAVDDNNSEKTFDKVMTGIYKQLRTTENPFKYIVLDNLSEIENQLLLCLVQRHGREGPSRQEYGDSAYKMREWIHLWRDLVFQGTNVIFNCWETPMELKNVEGNVVTLTVPKISKSNVPTLTGCVDVVGHLEVHEKTGKRWLRLRPNDECLCKSQFQGVGEDKSGEIADFGIIFGKILNHNYKTEVRDQEAKERMGEA